MGQEAHTQQHCPARRLLPVPLWTLHELPSWRTTHAGCNPSLHTLRMQALKSGRCT